MMMTVLYVCVSQLAFMPWLAKSADGACSAADEQQMAALGNGTSDNSFPGIVAKCGTNSYGVFTGFNTDDYVQCIFADTHITHSCAKCFGPAGRYGYEQCKVNCLFSWSSSGCLNCVKPAQAQVQACAGVQIPKATEWSAMFLGNPQSPAEPVLLDAGATPGNTSTEAFSMNMLTSVDPGCTATDEQQMAALGGGKNDNSFPGIVAQCGKNSYNLFSFNTEKYVQCIAEKTYISGDCAWCFGSAGDYGYNQCKWPCLTGWSSPGCLNCVKPAQAQVQACAGVQIPAA